MSRDSASLIGLTDLPRTPSTSRIYAMQFFGRLIAALTLLVVVQAAAVERMLLRTC